MPAPGSYSQVFLLPAVPDPGGEDPELEMFTFDDPWPGPGGDDLGDFHDPGDDPPARR